MEIDWDTLADRKYEHGVDRGVLYIPDENGDYNNGVPWNGITGVSESPTGGEPTPFYADNVKYLNVLAVEHFEATLEAFSYPAEFNQMIGRDSNILGLKLAQQKRKHFAFSFRTFNNTADSTPDIHYKLHIIYGCIVSAAETGYSTIAESPEVVQHSWDITTTPIRTAGHKPTAHIILDSRKMDTYRLRELEAIMYGDLGDPPYLPTPDEITYLVGRGTWMTENDLVLNTEDDYMLVLEGS